MTLTARQKYDYRDIDPWELKLIRVGHSIWAILKRERRLKSHSVGEQRALGEAIETIVRLKREYRSELKVRLAEKSKHTATWFAKRKAR